MQERSDSQPAAAAVFAANRAVGSVAFETRLVDGKTRRGDVHEAGSLRVRFPSPDTEGLSAVFVNTAGGIAGGDRFDIAIHAHARSRLTATTAAAEKIYRSHGPDSLINVRLRADADAHISWLPQETILFDQARVARSIDIDLAQTASLMLAEIVVFGRAAMGERVETGKYLDRWRLRRAGKLIFAENARLEGEISARLAQAAVARGGVALATVLIVPGDESTVTRVREAADRFRGEVGVSAWNGLALARFCADDAAQLRSDVIKVLAQVDARALPRLWLN